MKKLLLSAAIAVFAMSTMNAQEEQVFGFTEGNIFLEGTVGFGSANNKNTDTKTSGFNFSPKVGFFLSDDLAIGGELGIGSSKTEVSGTDTNDISAFGVGVFGRYYFLDLGKRFKTFVELGAGYNTDNNKISDVKVNTIGAGFDLGINYFVKENIALTFGLDNLLSFSTSKVDVSGAKATSNFNLGVGEVNNPFGNNANFGVLFIF